MEGRHGWLGQACRQGWITDVEAQAVEQLGLRLDRAAGWAWRPPDSGLPSLPTGLQGVEERLGGPLGMLRCWGRCLLVAGAKSYTHMVIALERYYGPLKNAVDAAGAEVGDGTLGGWLSTAMRQPASRRQEGRSGVLPLLVVAAQLSPAPRPALIPLQGEAALVDVANRVWRRSPQRAAMAVDRLMTLRLVSAEAIVK